MGLFDEDGSEDGGLFAPPAAPATTTTTATVRGWSCPCPLPAACLPVGLGGLAGVEKRWACGCRGVPVSAGCVSLVVSLCRLAALAAAADSVLDTAQAAALSSCTARLSRQGWAGLSLPVPPTHLSAACVSAEPARYDGAVRRGRRRWWRVVWYGCSRSG